MTHADTPHPAIPHTQVLAGIDLDSGPRSQDPAYRLAKNIRISMLYLEDDDSVSAESYIKKASALIGAARTRGWSCSTR